MKKLLISLLVLSSINVLADDYHLDCGNMWIRRINEDVPSVVTVGSQTVITTLYNPQIISEDAAPLTFSFDGNQELNERPYRTRCTLTVSTNPADYTMEDKVCKKILKEGCVKISDELEQ